MTVPVFVDTNVLVYARDASEPSKQPIAIEWLDHLWRDQSGRTSIQVLSEYYVTVTRKLSPGLHTDDAWDDVETLLSWRPAESGSALLRRGRDVEQRYRLSWWDSLIVAAAQLQACVVLLSEDMQDGATYGAVTVRSPFSLRVAEEATAYRQVRSTSHHRKRGRPKKAKQKRG